MEEEHVQNKEEEHVENEEEEQLVDDESFEILDTADIEEDEVNLEETFKRQDKELDDAIAKLASGPPEHLKLTKEELEEVLDELRRLEERLHLWREVRTNTVARLREIAEYMAVVGRRTGVAKVVGSSGGIMAGGLTLVGGVLTVLSAGTAVPVLLAGAGIGLASGVTGGAATITNKILSSRQMKEVEIAMEVDAAATKELEDGVDKVRNDERLTATNLMMTVGGLATSTKGIMDMVRGAAPGQTVMAGMEVIGKVLGEDVNKEIGKLLLHTSGRVISGTVTGVFGGVTMLWDMYQLKKGVRDLAGQGREGEQQIRNIADQLEAGLNGHFGDNVEARDDGGDEDNCNNNKDKAVREGLKQVENNDNIDCVMLENR